MRSVRGHDTLFGLITAFVMLSAAATASAGELFVMPYSCAVVGGRPVLTPSADHGYSVVGRREQREYSACSSMNPGLCKQWKLYRFDLDCGGTRVPWVSIAAAAGADRNGRSWLEHGRLHIEMPARWGMDPDDPCAQPFSDENWWRPGGFSRMCADRQAQARGGSIIEMPDGYAPLMGLDGIFVAEAAPKANPNPPASTAHNSSPVKTARPVPPKPVPASPENSPARPAAQPKETLSAKRDVLSPPAENLEPKNDVGASPPPSATALNSQLEVAPKIINQANPSQSAANGNASAANSAPPPASSNPVSTLETASMAAPTPGGVPAPEIQVPQQAPTITGSLPNASISTVASSVDTGVLAAVSLAVLGLMALSFFQWRERTQLRLTGSRDLAAVSLDGRTTTGRDVGFARNVAPANQTSFERQRPAPLDTAPRPNFSDEIPQTREQALQILGMGVTPDVRDAAIKKIVDGLRLSWHPDHAKSAEERQVRELRMKQINAAWDIIGGKRFT